MSIAWSSEFIHPDEPAPNTTLESPLHNVLKPSTREIVTMALEIPVYTAVGEGFTTCIRVCQLLARVRSHNAKLEGSGAP